MNLIHNLSSLVYKPAERRLFLTGARNAGKTTFLYHLKLGRAIKTVPTFGIGTESLKYNNKLFLIHDVGDCLDHQARPFLRWHLDSQAFVFFLHDCSSSGNIVESTNILHEHVRDLLDSGTRFLWIVLNKLDDGDIVETRNTARLAKSHFEDEMEKYDGRIVWKIILLDGLSGRTGRRVLDAMDDIWATFKAHREFVPVSRLTKSEGFQIRPSQDGRVSSLRGLEEVPSDLDSNAFWQAFQDGTIPSWTHRDRLRAAYMVLLKARERNQGILQLVEPFRAKEDAIHGNHSAWNRTLAVFWLSQLQSTLTYKSFNNGRNPLPEDFDHIIPRKCHLSNQDLCHDYYTETLLLSLRAEKYYCRPDLKDLPELRYSPVRWSPYSDTFFDPERLPRFAFAVVRTYLISPTLNRSWVIEQALSALQSTTMRTRASPRGNTVAPYSMTKTYFWISRFHTFLSSILSKLNSDTTSEKFSRLGSILHQLNFEGFRSMVPVNWPHWTEHYSPTVWDSVAARATFVPPDIEPLNDTHNFLASMTLEQIQQAQEASRKYSVSAELPSDEELAFRLALCLNQAAAPFQSKCPINSHAHMLMELFERLVHHPNLHASGGNRVRETVPVPLGSADADQKRRVFWEERVREALLAPNARLDTERNRNLAFETFLRGSIHLVYDGLFGTSNGSTGGSVPLDEKVELSMADPSLEESEQSNTILVIEKLDDSVAEDENDIEKTREDTNGESWEVV